VTRTLITETGQDQSRRKIPVRPALPLLGVAAVTLAVVLSGCVGNEPSTSTSAATTTPTPTPTPTEVPVLFPGGTAEQNKPLFDYINNQVIELNGGAPDGPSFVDGLRSNGFPGEAMELTPDITTVGVRADSIQFSVHMTDACLIGQWGAAVQYHSVVTPVLSTGKCLIGQTRTIDF
jgi:hypothetical protein